MLHVPLVSHPARAVRRIVHRLRDTYPGFIVMKQLVVAIKPISTPSKMNLFNPAAFALCMVRTCCATTDRTSSSIRLNSSKQAQAPEQARPAACKSLRHEWSHPLMCETPTMPQYSLGLRLITFKELSHGDVV